MTKVMKQSWAYSLVGVPWLTEFIETGHLPSTMPAMTSESLMSALIAFCVWLLLRRAKKEVASREAFLSVASHELRTPLTALRLQVQNMKRALVDLPATGPNSELERVREALDICDMESRRLVDLITALLDDTRLAGGMVNLSLEEQDFLEIVRRTIGRFEGDLSRRGIPLTLEAEGPIMGNWDRLCMEQVVANILSNAIKYGNSKPIAVCVVHRGKTLEFSVTDQGQGIDPSFLPSLFKRFERALHSPGEGLGLGLFIAKEFVSAHGGSILVQSKPGEGSTFTVVVPLKLESRIQVA